MPKNDPEFDGYSEDYENLLADPLRDTFAGGKKFFHQRKWLLIEDFFRRRKQSTQQLTWLDVGCGKGELLRCGEGSFGAVTGCDPSTGMMSGLSGIAVEAQTDPTRLPFPDASFDFVTSVCVYHHVRPTDREALSREIVRVLRPNGIFSMIEHNPWNPVTRLIVSRTAVDTDAVLLTSSEARSLQRQAGLRPEALEFFLYLPESIFAAMPWAEHLVRHVPLGGQYASFAIKTAR
jgi:SAM-dependent methyltransferase